jgi:hypothetical protein
VLCFRCGQFFRDFRIELRLGAERARLWPSRVPSVICDLKMRLDPLILDLRRRCGSFINSGQAKSANFCVNRNSPVTSLTDFCLRQGVRPSARSKPPQERGLDDYSTQCENNRQECKFISSEPPDEESQAGKENKIECD